MYSKRYAVPQDLVVCMVIQESGGDPNATRPEPTFYRRYIERPLKQGKPLPGFMPKGLSQAEYTRELNNRAISWGLLQVMGQVARELHYRGRYLETLKDPAINLDVGCRFLRRLQSRYGTDERAMLLRWNGGADPNYPDEVRAWKSSSKYSELYLP